MQMWFQRLIDVSSVAHTEASLKEALRGLVRELGFDCYAYLNVQPVRTYAVSNYPAEWQRHYLDSDYTRVDPVVASARAKMEAFTWAAGTPRKASSKAVRTFFAEAEDFGVRSGISIPIRTAFGHMSMLTLASNKRSLQPCYVRQGSYKGSHQSPVWKDRRFEECRVAWGYHLRDLLRRPTLQRSGTWCPAACRVGRPFKTMAGGIAGWRDEGFDLVSLETA